MLKVSKTTRTTLFSNDWVALKEVKNPDEGVNGYAYLHESRCDGKIIVLLPFRRTKPKTNTCSVKKSHPAGV